uniref:G-protein coupled receptors family 1 profile domain-containing protein n=1 Tax=Apteryx owenii TaxID=8824 RepID=A0A8B9QDJ4_APTOW
MSSLYNKISNGSSLNEFLLLPFADTRELQLLHFALFLGIYLAALLGNGLIITAVACDHHLHTPMYFFLLNLSLFDLGAISTTVPKSMWENCLCSPQLNPSVSQPALSFLCSFHFYYYYYYYYYDYCYYYYLLSCCCTNAWIHSIFTEIALSHLVLI